MGYPIEERAITVHELYNADEVFVSGTAAEIVPIVKVAGRTVGDGKPGPVFSRFLDGFKELTKKSNEETPLD